MVTSNPKNRLEREGVTVYRRRGPRLTPEEKELQVLDDARWSKFEAEADAREAQEKRKASSGPAPTKK